MYTNNPLSLTADLERTKRALRVWRHLTNAIRLIMAVPEKRTLGSWGRWPGVNVFSNLGLVVVPRDKVLRASAAIADVLERGVHFPAYRSLCGLLEHLRAVNLQARNIIYLASTVSMDPQAPQSSAQPAGRPVIYSCASSP